MYKGRGRSVEVRRHLEPNEQWRWALKRRLCLLLLGLMSRYAERTPSSNTEACLFKALGSEELSITYEML